MSLSCHSGTYRASSAAEERVEEVVSVKSRAFARRIAQNVRIELGFLHLSGRCVLCGPLPSDKEHGFPQPSPRRTDVCWNAGLLGRDHVQHHVGVRGKIR